MTDTPPITIPTDTKFVKLTDADNGKIVQGKKGDFIVITLVWKPSSGFFWQEAETTAATMEEIRHEGDNPVPGGSAYVTFKFQIQKSGIIELDMGRPWAETEPPAKWFVIKVMVVD